MRIKHFEYLIDLKQSNSLSKTAEKFFTTHQVISKAIKQLEDELNVQILERTNRGISFTDTGLIVYKYAKSIIDNKNALLQEIAFNTPNNAFTGELNIYIIPRYMNNYFMNFYNNYQAKHPQLTLILKNISLTETLCKTTFDGNTVILCTSSHLAHDHQFLNTLTNANLTYSILSRHQLGFCISKNAFFKSKVQTYCDSNLVFPDGIDFPVVSFRYSDFNNSMLSLSEGSFISLIDNIDIQKDMVKSGKYAGLMTAFEYNKLFSQNTSLQYIPISDGMSKHDFCYIVLYPQFPVSETVTHFLDSLKQYYCDDIGSVK